MIRVMIAEDQSMVRGALAALLNLSRDIEVVAEVGNGREALDIIDEACPDVLLTDIEMPEVTGLELAQKLKERRSTCRVIVLSTFARPGYLRRALDAGVVGYLLKDSPSEQLAAAIRRVHDGGRAVDPELAMEAWTEEDPLTDRERQTLRLAEEGWSSARIAGEIHVTEGTVRNYLSEAIGKLGAKNRVEAARIARRKGWL